MSTMGAWESERMEGGQRVMLVSVSWVSSGMPLI